MASRDCRNIVTDIWCQPPKRFETSLYFHLHVICFHYTDMYLFPVIFGLTAGLNQDFLNTRSSLTFVTNIKIEIIKEAVNMTIISTGNIANSRNVECIKYSLKQTRLTRYCTGLTTSIIVLRVCRFILWGLFCPENNAEAINLLSSLFKHYSFYRRVNYASI
jgi:hypothetical protein